MNLKLEEEFSKAPILEEVDALKKQIDDMRPLPPDVEGRVIQKLRLDWNYNSNAIEGNKLSYGETVAFLMEGITAKGKPLKDHLDIRGHNEAINFLLSIVKDTRPISEADIRALHTMILVEPYEVKAQTTDGLPTTKWIKLGEYKVLPNHVQTATGETHYYTSPEETPAKMQELTEWYHEVCDDKNVHPVVAAALFHHKFVSIHPFDDGNGRLSRILMNLILMQKDYPPVVVKMEDRKNYYSLLSRADVGDSWPFIEYIAEGLQSSLQLYLKAANGGDIDEDDDIDKEIELLKTQLSGGILIKQKKDAKLVQEVFFKSLLPLSIRITDKLKNFQDYFYQNNYRFQFHYVNSTTQMALIGDEFYIEYLNKLSEEVDEITGFETYNIKKIDIDLKLREYKNPDNNFSIQILLNIEFGDYRYKILNNNNLLISKLYEERLSPQDQNRIIKTVIQDFKTKFEQNQKKPEV